jgi:hypothetical protein
MCLMLPEVFKVLPRVVKLNFEFYGAKPGFDPVNSH